MTEARLGQLEEVDIRSIWENEARDFTPWLAEHLDLLGNAIGLELERIDTEVPVGRYWLDILAEAEGIGQVAIENQLGTTDHSHLGQLATYAAGVEARALVWVAADFHPEHLAAIEWLNQWTEVSISVFAVEVRALQIGDSLPAPEFRAIAHPADWVPRQASPAEGKGMPADERERRVEFFDRLVAGANERGLMTSSYTWSVAKSKSFPCSVEEQGLRYWIDLHRNGVVTVQLEIRTADIKRNTSIIRALDDEKREIWQDVGFRPELRAPDPNGPRGRIKGMAMMIRDTSLDDPPEIVHETLTWCLDVLEGFQTKLEPRLAEIIQELQTEQSDAVSH